MTDGISWQEHAVSAAARFLLDDPEGLRQLFAAVDSLADNTRPVGSTAHGSPDLRRIHIGMYRVVYEVIEAPAVVVIIQAGRLG